MSYDSNCFYCVKDQRLDDLAVEIAKLDVSTLYLFKEQTYHGRCLIAFDRHVKDFTMLEKAEMEAFFGDITRVGKALYQAFKPDKVNYGMFSDKLAHLHCHIAPKYEGGPNWGGTFQMMPQPKKLLTVQEYQELVKLIKNYL